MPTPINISASRGAAILGLSNWSTPFQIWLQIMESREPGFCEKNNYELPVFEYSQAMKWGHAFESAIIELAEKKMGRNIIDREYFYATNATNHFFSGGSPIDEKSKNYITCHIDGWYLGVLDPGTLHEGKTTSAFYYRDNFGEPGTDKVPIEYQIQCQHQMICTGAEKVILSVLVFPKRVEGWGEMGWEILDKSEIGYLMTNNNFTLPVRPHQWAYILDQMGYFHQYEINAKPELHKIMIEHYTKFWNKNIIEKNVPKPKTYDDIRSICREPIGTIIADEEIERFMSEYRNIKSEIGTSGSLEKRAAQIKVLILNYMRNHGCDAVDDDSKDKWILRDRAGKKIAQYDGKVFR